MDWPVRAAKLGQWTGNGIRAPHEPLLLLYALGRFQEDTDGELRYSAVEKDMKLLLAEYGPANRTTPAPSSIWSATGWGKYVPIGGPAVLAPACGSWGRRAGRLVPELLAALLREPSLLGRIARVLLDQHFSPSLHGELREAVGLGAGAGGVRTAPGRAAVTKPADAEDGADRL